jgi:hypothetical protein
VAGVPHNTANKTRTPETNDTRDGYPTPGAPYTEKKRYFEMLGQDVILTIEMASCGAPSAPLKAKAGKGGPPRGMEIEGKKERYGSDTARVGEVLKRAGPDAAFPTLKKKKKI